MSQRRLAVVLTTALLLAALPADAANLGLYFDTESYPTEIESDGPVDAWLVLRDLESPNLVAGWECSVEALGEGSDPVMIWELLGNGPYNFATPPQFAVGMQVPFPATPEITLAHVTVVPTSAGQAIDLHVQPFMYPSLTDEDGHPIWLPVIARNQGGDLLQLVDPAAGASWLPEARVNPAGPPLPPEIAVTGDGHFGAVSPGGEEIRTLILNQPGPATVYGRLEVTGADYAIRIDGGEWTDDGRWLALPPGEDVAVDLRFAPAFGGPSHGSLILQDGGPLDVIPLTGGGGEAPALVLEPDVLDFGSVPPDGTSQRNVVLRNTGDVPVTVAPGMPPDGFELIDPPGAVEIPPAGTLELTIAFVPPSEGLWLLELDLGPGLPPVLGRGHAASSSGCVTEVADPEGGDFGVVLLGESVERDVTYLNVGPWDIAGEVHLEGDLEAFEITSGGGPVQVPAGGSHTVTVRCEPAAAGSWAAGLIGPESCSSVPLSCEAEAVVIACEREPELLDFGSLVIGDNLTLPVTVTNAGNVPLSGEVTVSGHAAFTIVAGGGPFTLAPGEQRNITVHFAPVAVGAYTGSLDLGTADCDPVPLVGAGREPDPICAVSPETWVLSPIYVNTVHLRAVTVTNAGSVPFAIDPIIVPADSPFSHDGTARVLEAGESAEFTLRFESADPGQFTATLDLGSPACAEIPLSAVVLTPPSDDVNLGIYFDTVTYPTEIESDGPVEAWLVLRDITSPNLVAGWECSVETLTEGADPVMIWELLGAGPYNFFAPPQFAVGMQIPFPSAPEIALAHVTIVPATAGQALDLHVQPLMYPSLADADGHPIWRPVIARNQDGELLQLVEPYAGSSWEPEARVNPALPTLPPGTAMTGDGHFGAVPPGGEEVRTLVLNQPGPATVYGRLEVNAEDYAIRIDGGAWTGDGRWLALPPGEDVAVDLRFAPTFAGPSHGSLILEDGGPLRVIALTGGGGEAPALVIEPDVVCFGSVPPGGTNQRSAVLRNTGDVPLTVTPGIPSEGFELIDPPGAVEIPPAGTLELTIAFVPPDEGLWLLELDLGAGLPPVLGRGHAASSSGCITEVAHPDGGDFGSVVIGLPEERDVTFVNVGSWDLAGDVHLEGDLEAFEITSGGGMVQVPAGGSHTVTVRCDPAAAGAWAAVLVGPESCSSVPLSCEAETMVIACEREPEALDFGAVATDHELTLPVTVTNAGNMPLAGEAAVSGDAAFTITTGGGPFTLPPGAQRIIAVRFAPTALGVFTGSLDLGTADCDPVPLVGTGRDPAPICEVDAEVLDFGEVEVGRTRVESLTVRNGGELPLTIEPLVTGEWFRLAADPGPVTIAPADTLDLAIEFRSPAEGPHDGQLDLGHPGCPAVALTADGEYGDVPSPCAFFPILIEFPDTPVGGSSLAEVSVTNGTEAPMTLAVITSDPDVFTVVDGADLVLEPHTARWLTVRFTPLQVRAYDESIFSGTGCGAVLRGEGLEAGCHVDPPALDFPTAAFGTELIETVTIANNTPESLVLAPQTDHPAFTVDGTPVELSPQQEHALDVTFLADAPGSYVAVLDLGPEICADVDLSAVAVDSLMSCEVTPESWLLGPVYVTMVYLQDVTVTNTGTVPFAIDPVVEPAESPFSHDGTASIVGAGETVVFTLSFQSAVTGEFTATLNVGTPGCADIPLSATAMDLPPGDCELVPSALSLGEIPVGLFVTWQGTVTNLGDTPLAVDLGDQTGEVMFISGGGPRSLEPGEVHEYVARFYAPQQGEFAYEVSFGDVEAVLSVEGFGTPPAYPCEIEPYVIDCGTVVVGQSSFERFSIRNVSDSGIQLQIPDQLGPFTISGGGSFLLGPLEYYRPGARFEPTEPGTFFLELDLGPDSCGPALLRGTATASITGVVALARRLDFGVLDPGETGRMVLEVANNGDETVTVTPTILGGGFFLDDPGTARGAAPGEILTIAVSCRPEAPGDLRGRLSLGVEGHPDVTLIARGRDPDLTAPVLAVTTPDGPVKSGDDPSLSCELQVSGLEPGTELAGWRAVLSCEGGRIVDLLLAGAAESVGPVDGAPLVILPGDPLRADSHGVATLATFHVEADGPGEVVLRAHGGAGRDWPLITVRDLVDRDEAAVPVGEDHVVARLTIEPPAEIPAVTQLRPVYPNPFNPGTNVAFELARAGRVRLRIFDVSGRLVTTLLDETRTAGSHLVRWEGRDDRGRGAASGTYYLRMESGGVTQLQKMTLLK